jgi:hypothetical protein
MLRRLIMFVSAGLLLGLPPIPPTFAQDVPYCQPGETPSFYLGSADLSAQLGDVMGDPIECAHMDTGTGDIIQLTTTGIATLRADNSVLQFREGVTGVPRRTLWSAITMVLVATRLPLGRSEGISFGLPGFVPVLRGEYCFLPGLSGIQWLAS